MPAPRCSVRGQRGWPTPAEVAARCQVELEFERYRFPGFPVPSGETAFSELRELCHDGARRRYHPLDAARRQAAGARAGGHRADRPGRVLPDLLGPDAVLPRARHPRAGSRECRQFDRGVRAGHHPRRSHPPQPAVRALHQRGPTSATRTWTSTSPRPGARRSSSTSTSATAPSTRAWSATSSPTGHARPCARWAMRWASRGRWSIGWPRRSRRTTR